MKSAPIFFSSNARALALACSADANRAGAGVGAGNAGIGLPPVCERTAISGQDNPQRSHWAIFAQQTSRQPPPQAAAGGLNRLVIRHFGRTRSRSECRQSPE